MKDEASSSEEEDDEDGMEDDDDEEEIVSSTSRGHGVEAEEVDIRAEIDMGLDWDLPEALSSPLSSSSGLRANARVASDESDDDEEESGVVMKPEDVMGLVEGHALGSVFVPVFLFMMICRPIHHFSDLASPEPTRTVTPTTDGT